LRDSKKEKLTASLAFQNVAIKYARIGYLLVEN